jgi:hypothetical protein
VIEIRNQWLLIKRTKLRCPVAVLSSVNGACRVSCAARGTGESWRKRRYWCIVRANRKPKASILRTVVRELSHVVRQPLSLALAERQLFGRRWPLG